MNRKLIAYLFCSVLFSFHGFSQNTNSVKSQPSPEILFTKILSDRTELDKELEIDSHNLDSQKFEAAKIEISKEAKQLSRDAETFLEDFPTNKNVLKSAQQETYGETLNCMLHKEDAYILGSVAENLPSCLVETFLIKNFHLSDIQAAQLESAEETSFVDGAIAAMNFGPESYNGIDLFMTRARTDAGKRLAKALLQNSNTNNNAQSVLSRKYSVGQSLPFQFTAIDGRQVDLSKMRGKVILVDFWAHDCVPCMAQLPKLESLYQKYQAQGFEIVGINTDSEKQSALRVIQGKNIPWPNYWDADGHTNKFAMACGVWGIPDYWLVDRKGIVREMMADFNVEKKIQLLLAESP